MTHIERVEALFAGERPDRPVVDLGGRVASVNVNCYLELKACVGLEAKWTNETTTLLNTVGYFDPEVLDRFDVPFRRVFLNPPSYWNYTPASDGTFLDEWGCLIKPRGPLNERVGHPLAEADGIEAIERHPWPDANDPGRVAGVAERARSLVEEGRHFVEAGHVSAGIFQDCWNLRGMEQFLIDMLTDADFAHAMLDHVTAVHEGLWRAFLKALGPNVHMVGLADDIGTQVGPLLAPHSYREMLFPYHKRLVEFIRERTSAKIFYHSCGNVEDLIDDLLDSGIDILNPIQPLQLGMEPETLRRRWGNRLVFHGGLDVQQLLPFGNPAAVREHVHRYYDALGEERYVMAPANTILPGTPPENIVAAFDAAASRQS